MRAKGRSDPHPSLNFNALRRDPARLATISVAFRMVKPCLTDVAAQAPLPVRSPSPGAVHRVATG